MMVGKSPIVILNIEVDPSIIDVNVHPTKMDIKFSKIEELEDLIIKTIDNALKKLILIPEIKDSNKVVTNIDKVTTINSELDFKEKAEVKPEYEEITFDIDTHEEEKKYEESKDDYVIKNRPKRIQISSIIAQTYLIGENEDGMYIIDQHAAHERINYERIIRETKKEKIGTIDMLVPIKLTFTKDEYLKLKTKEEELKKLGIEYEEFGINTIIIRKHPKWLNKNYVTDTLRKMIELLIEDTKLSKEKFNDHFIATTACRMSIKANDYISLEEANELVETLLTTCENPYHCPHGRPVIIHYTYYELEKLFKRVV